MRTSELEATATSVRPIFDSSFLRRLVWVAGATPAVLLAWDAATGHLGVNGVNYAIRTTGMLTLVFLVLALAVTPLRKLTGTAMLIAIRRSLGLFSFGYLVTHVSLFYALDRGASLASTLHEIVMRRYLQIGTIALLLMIALASTSTDSAVRRLGAKRWKRLHRLAYVVGALGCIHYFMLVKADVRKPLVFAGVVTLLLAYRVLTFLRDARKRTTSARPSARTWSGELRILSTKQETKDVRTLRLASKGGGVLPFAFAPGQYLNVTFELDGKKVRRSYTIASSAEEREHCEITVRRTEDGWVSRHVHEGLAEGDSITVTAPAGRFVFDPQSDGERVTLIGAGVGITPLMSIVRSMTDHGWGGRIEMILSMRSAEEIIFAKELQERARRFPNLRVTITLTRGSAATHRQGRLTKEMLADILGGAPAGPVYLCGPEPMMREVRAALLLLGVSERAIRTEAFVSPTASSRPHQGDDDAQTHEVVFERQGLVALVPRSLTLLEAAEDAGLTLPFECRAGICGQCKVRILEGEVRMDSEDALSRAEKIEGIALACQAHAVTDVVVEGD